MEKRIILCLAISLSLLASYAVADETYTCTYGSQERIISVVYQDQEMKVPCEVQYQKDGVTETLWSAQNEVGYCEAKAAELVEKQRGWGWNCAEAGESMAGEGMMQEGMHEEMQEGMMKEGMHEEMQEGMMKEGMHEEMQEGMHEKMHEEMHEGMKEEGK